MASSKSGDEPQIVCDPSSDSFSVEATPYRDAALATRVVVGERQELQAPDYGRLAVAFSPDSSQIAFGADETIRIWDLRARVQRGEDICIAIRAGGWLGSLAFSPDGRFLAVGCQDYSARLIDLDTRVERMLRKKSAVGHALRADGDFSRAIAFSSDGQLLAAGSSEEIVLWDVASGEEVERLGGWEFDVRDVAFAGENLLAGGTAKVQLWEVGQAGQSTLKQTIDPPELVWGLALSPDGSRLATGDSASSLVIWDLHTGGQLHRCLGHSGAVRAVAFAPNAEVVASYGEDETVRLWSARGGGQQQRLDDLPARGAHTVAFSPDGRWLSAGGLGQTIAVWPLDWSLAPAASVSPPRNRPLCRAKLGEARTIDVPCNAEQHVLFGNDSRLLIVGGRNAVRLWRLNNSGPPVAVHSIETNSAVVGLALHPDGNTLAVSCDDGKVRLFDLESRTLVRSLRKCGLLHRLLLLGDQSRGISFGRDVLAVPCGKTVVLWQLSTWRRWRLGRSFLNMRSVACHEWLLAAGCASVELWDHDRGLKIQQIDPTNNALVWHLAFSADGTLLATGDSNNRLSLWDTKSGHEVRRHEGHSGDVRAVAFDPLGQMVASYGDDNTVRVWCLGNGAVIARLEQVTGHRPSTLAFSPDGQWLAAGPYGETITLWPLDRGK